jgi:hypothetical protein
VDKYNYALTWFGRASEKEIVLVHGERKQLEHENAIALK